MTTITKSQFFRLRELSISGYKNINHLELNFENQDGITVLIGNNGCGKSNIIEALSSIFASLFQEKLIKPDFEFSIKYEISYHDVEVVYDGQDYLVTIDKKETNKSTLEKEKEIYLPKNVIACYSGEYLRLYESYYKPFLDNYISTIKKTEIIPSLPLLYVSKSNIEISLLTLFHYDFTAFTDISDFCHKTLGIKRIKDVSITLGSKKGINSWKENEVLHLVKMMLDSRELKNGVRETLKYDILKNRLSLYFGNERKLFQLLYGATMSNKGSLIEDIEIQLELNTGAIVNVKDLSEGEKKYILMKVILETLADENSLLLFDEPDSHIHISRKAELGLVFDKYKNRENVITTHSPTMALTFSSHLVGLGVKNGSVEVIDKKKEMVLDRLTDGIWNAHEQNVFLASDKPMTLLVEGKTDKCHIEEAFKRLKNDYPNLTFDVFSMNSSEHIRETLIGLSCSEITWDKQFVGIFDNDPAGLNGIKGFVNESTESQIKHVKYQDGTPSNCFFAFLLPKPIVYNDKYVTIENCYNPSKYEEAFKQAMQYKEGHFSGLSIDTIATDIKNKSKTILAENAKSFLSSDFDGFRPIFDLLEKIRCLK